MKKLNIKKGDFSKYESIYQSGIYSNIDFLKEHGLAHGSSISHFNVAKQNLLKILPDQFNESSSNTITQESLDNLIKIYDKYQLTPFKTELKSITINEELEIDDMSHGFVKDFIFNSEIKIICKQSFQINSFNIYWKIDNFEFKKSFIIKSSNQKTFWFRNCKIDKNFSFNPKDVKNIQFYDCEINSLTLMNLNYLNNDGDKKEPFVYFCNCSGNISIIESTIGELLILNSCFGTISISNNNFTDRVKISSYSPSYPYPLEDKEYKVKGKILFKGNTINSLRIGHGVINELEIRNIKNPSDSEINLGNLEVNKLTFSNIRNLGKFRIYDINNKLRKNYKKKEEISINNCSLGDSEFQNVNMQSFKVNKIYDNLFSNLKYTGIEWKYDISTDKEKDFGGLRDTYRTLKNVAEKNNDSITANKFYEQEMNSYYFDINKKKIFSNFMSYFDSKVYDKYGKNIGEKIVLNFSKVLSEFGNNWIITIMWLLIFVFISTYLKLLFSDKYLDQLIGIPSRIINDVSKFDGLLQQGIYTLLFTVLMIILLKYLIKAINWFLHKGPVLFSIALFIGIYFLYDDNILNDFLRLLFNPLYGFKDLYSEEMGGWNLLGFTIYKILYIIIVWHLVVALKRTTKR